MSDLLKALERAIDAEPDVYWAMERGQRIPNAALERILSVIEGCVRAEERERAARIALEYAAPLRRNAKDATDGVGYVVNEGCALVAESIATAIRSGDEG